MIQFPNDQTRFVIKSLEEIKPTRILNVGFRIDSIRIIPDWCRANDCEFEVCEPWLPNVEAMEKEWTCHACPAFEMKNIEHKPYDVILWLHGPEHVLWDDFVANRKDLEALAKQLVIYQAPIGECPQDDIYGNPWERHVQTLRPEMFRDLGYNIVIHDKDGEWTFSAWKKPEES